MSTSKQIILSVFLVAAAAVVVVWELRSGEPAGGDAAAGGHDMAAMGVGGDVKQPVVLDEAAARLIGVAFATVEHRVLPGFVQTVGTVVYDETRLTTVNPKIEGWIEHLYVDFTGAPIREGEPLMDVYSPALVSAQEELILAVKLVREAKSGRPLTNAEELLTSARRRLAYWDIPEDEIRRIEERREPSKTLMLRSPATGIVVEKNVVEGDRIVGGMTVYRIADLSRVWIEADIFEKDLALVREHQGALISFQAYPGEVYTGRVTYVYPTVSVQSRTARVRLELSNPDLAFKPGMYAQIRLESLPTEPTLVVPRSAVIATGERALVFVQGAEGALWPREVQPGRTAGQYMQILSGLEMGERIVSSAAFLVDAESNLGTMTGDLTKAEDHEGMEGMETPDTGQVSDGTSHEGHEE